MTSPPHILIKVRQARLVRKYVVGDGGSPSSPNLSSYDWERGPNQKRQFVCATPLSYENGRGAGG
jgi:hypothetical protein